MTRTVIIGGPRTGKTTLAAALGVGMLDVRSTDDLIKSGIDWSQQSEQISTWFDVPGPWIIEGVAVPRALRKWLARRPDGRCCERDHDGDGNCDRHPRGTERPRPCDIAYVLSRPHVDLTAGQSQMAKAVKTVWSIVLPELLKRGVEVRVVDKIEGVAP